MTNREMLLNALLNKNDDWATTESDIVYHIACPYHSGNGHPCEHQSYPFNEIDVCGSCKMEWLDKEVSE